MISVKIWERNFADVAISASKILVCYFWLAGVLNREKIRSDQGSIQFLIAIHVYFLEKMMKTDYILEDTINIQTGVVYSIIKNYSSCKI